MWRMTVYLIAGELLFLPFITANLWPKACATDWERTILAGVILGAGGIGVGLFILFQILAELRAIRKGQAK